ncbi:MAG: hypothetical protein CSA55_02585 [Ilumatobacter coccineus]|uniref:Uncharacterized protein n=1 Tax=Ilumatobacter coccineus TaxID=467094 RepID=A0A2G6KB64_9ACTN|nr:MAG: hypothetical protein CSA55_02585 [Ilumatobacter coccineus]
MVYDQDASPPATEPDPPEAIPFGWSIVLIFGWSATAVSFAAIWTTVRRLGLSTWWTGSISHPQPVLRMIPFIIAGIVMVKLMRSSSTVALISTIGGVMLAVVGIIDLWPYHMIGIVELAVALAITALSVLALTQRSRPS